MAGPPAFRAEFEAIGKHVDLYNQMEAWRAALDTVEGEAAALLDDSRDELDALKRLLDKTATIDSAIVSGKAQVVSVVKDFLKGPVATAIGYTGSSLDLIDIVENFAEAMEAEASSIDGSAVTVETVPAEDPDNAGTGQMASPTNLSQLCGDEYWELECVDASTAGEEQWEVRGEPAKHGKLSARLTTGEAYAAVDRNGQALFSALLSVIAGGLEVDGDEDDELSGWTFSGAERGENCDALGDVYCALDLLSASESGDGDNQVSGWTNITGLKLGVNADADGKLHLSVIDDTGGYFHVALYKAAARAAGDLVGHTATYNSTGAKTILPDNSSGLGGAITVDAVVGADSDINYLYAFRRVRAYKEVGMSNVVAIGGLLADGATILVTQNSSGLTGAVTVAYDDGEASVQVRCPIAGEVGDKWGFELANDGAGTFSEFFRKEIGVALPVNLAGAETIADSLAE
jgi:hypothetical protein